MLAAAVIGFREGLEAALIVGIILGYLRKTGQSARNRSALAGVAAAIALSIALAVVITLIGAELEGQAEQLFEGTTMFVAVAILTWMLIWMRTQSRKLKSSLEHEMADAINGGQSRGLFAVTFIAVFREGVETALLLSAAAFATSGLDTLVGSLLGLVLAVIVGYLLYGATLRLNLRTFFNVTSALLLIFAAGLFAHGIHEYQEAGLLPVIIEHVWDTSAILSQSSTLGELLSAIVGYTAAPSLLEVAGYLAYWGFALVGVPWLVNRKIERAQETPPPVVANA